MKPLRIAFITGARSEYGVARPLLKTLADDGRVELSLIVHGMHLAAEYGHSVDEIYRDGYHVVAELDTISNSPSGKEHEFSRTLEQLASVVGWGQFDLALIVGDRLEALAAALACSLEGLPIVHSGGGHITAGATDNRYRYMISALADLHLVTAPDAYERLKAFPALDLSCVYHVGSFAVDGIKSFLASPLPISRFVPELEPGNFALVTFHPATARKEALETVIEASVPAILGYDCAVLLTSPNNDSGSEVIHGCFEQLSGLPGVHYVAHLGAEGFYAALNDCLFVLGNSSSGIMEAPYFKKPVINVGARQEGRLRDRGVFDVPAEARSVVLALRRGFAQGWAEVSCDELFGDGHSAARAKDAILRQFCVGGSRP